MTTQQPGSRRPSRPASQVPALKPGHPRVRAVVWTLALLAGGLVLVLLFFATIGVIDFSQAPVLGFAALAMAIYFIVIMWTFSRSGDRRLADRERRGF